MLAEFDIDVGCVVREQYPYELPACRESNILSDLMLPEGSHKFEEDECFFILHSPHSEDAAGEDDCKLSYAFNLVRNKRDSNVRRGAIVKAIALVTSSVDCLDMLWAAKPLLRDALEVDAVDPNHPRAGGDA